MSEHDDAVAKVAELLSGKKLAMLGTTAPDGTLMSRPMALQEVEFDGDVWLFAERDSRKVAHIGHLPQVNLAVSGLSTWLSVTGLASVVDDVERKKRLWNAGAAAWLPQGPEDPSVVLIRIEATSAEYWDTPGGIVASAVSFAKAKITGQRYEGGDNARVDLDDR
ncbi:pyridoxamine 5'-phosphate oxidase family protein [Lentzea sp.]|uniref:pyridoxamine 5'-phosphate oxidase family protein n=1 Tax=Lentzea sp. TaxID=56099 RepID=UPI002ECFDA1D